MSRGSSVAPRFAPVIAAAIMVQAMVWGVVRSAETGFSPAAAGALVLMAAAFLLARQGSRVRPQPLLAGSAALAAVSVWFAAHSGLTGSDAWLTSAVACIALLLIWRGHHRSGWATVAGMVVVVGAVGGFALLQDLGVLVAALTIGVIAAAGHALGWYDAQMARYADAEREALEWRTAQDAYQLGHQQRIARTGEAAGGMLRLISARDGVLDPADRRECRLLHQAIRDETRGRLLLDDAVREAVRQHRRRGATVQLLDDGGLDLLDPEDLALLHQQIAERITPLSSDRIVIRSKPHPDGSTVSIVATTIDPIAEALGQSDDEQVDLWHEIQVDAFEPEPARA